MGLARGGAVVRAVSLDDRRRHVRDLALTVSTVLEAEGLSPADLTGVMVGRGPGSYTGLRVGLMSAKALAYATGCELRAVDTFAAIAEQAPRRKLGTSGSSPMHSRDRFTPSSSRAASAPGIR